MQRNYAEYSPVSRRQALVGIGTLAAGGVGLSAVAVETAGASVSVDSFAVSDAEFTAESVTPVLDVTLVFDYDVGNQPVSSLRFAVSVGDSQIAEKTLNTGMATYEGTETLSGVITDSDAWSASDFSPPVADSVSRQVSVSVLFAVRDSDGAAIASDTASDTATVSVSHPQETEYVASVGGSGAIQRQD